MNKIFVSFSSKDRAFVDTFLLASQEYPDLNLWASHKSSLSSGENFKNKIIQEIESSDGAIIFVSNKSLTSDFINQTEFPEIFKKKSDNSNYKIVLVFVDKCSISENEYLKDLQFINSLSTSLVDSSSSQIDNTIRDVFNSIITSSGSKRKRSKVQNALFVWLPLTLIVLFIFNSINNFDEELEEIDIGMGTSDQSTIQSEISVKESSTEDSLCFSNEIIEVWDKNWIETPAIEADLPFKNCNGKIFGHVYYSEEINLSTEDLTESLVDTILTENTQDCFIQFKNTYGYSSNETPLDYLTIYVEDDNQQLEVICFSMFVTVNEENFAAFTLDLIDIDIKSYRASNGMFLTNLFDFKTGECLTYPDSLYGPVASEDIEQVYSSSCSSPHGLQVIKSFNYKPDSESNIEVIEEFLLYKCGIYSDILLSNLDEVKGNRTYYGMTYIDSYFLTEYEKLRNGEEVKVLCVVGNSNVLDIKVDYDYLDLVNKKIFKRELVDYSFISITNCNDEPLKAALPDDYEFTHHDFSFKWQSHESDIVSLNFSFKDEDYFVELTYIPEGDFEKELVKQWESITSIAPVAFSNDDKLEVIATMELENGESYSDSCSYNLYLDQ
jgi:hypothetical protein